jgi:hypothetical protein
MTFSTPPAVIQIDHKHGLSLCDRDLRDEFIVDPRGLVWIWEPPVPSATYVLSADPTKGIPGWCRSLRSQDDHRTDNAAVQVLRKGDGTSKHPDRQVAEYAAPIDPFDLAPVLNILGRMYGGSQEDGQALCIIEVWPGPGLQTQRTLLESYGYTNFFIWKYLDRAGLKYTTSLGWNSTTRSVRDLWILGTHHIEAGYVALNSPWLIDEMTDCENDPVKMRGKSVYGRHDDRVSALLMGLWVANDWTGQVENLPTVAVDSTTEPNWQASDLSAEDMMTRMDELFEESLDQ